MLIDFSLCWYLHWRCKSNGGKTAGISAPIKAVVPNHSNSRYIFQCHALEVKTEEIQLHLRMPVMKQFIVLVKLGSIKSWPLSTQLFNNSVTKWELHIKHSVASPSVNSVWLNCELKMRHFSWNTTFLERTTGKEISNI